MRKSLVLLKEKLHAVDCTFMCILLFASFMVVCLALCALAITRVCKMGLYVYTYMCAQCIYIYIYIYISAKIPRLHTYIRDTHTCIKREDRRDLGQLCHHQCIITQSATTYVPNFQVETSFNATTYVSNFQVKKYLNVVPCNLSVALSMYTKTCTNMTILVEQIKLNSIDRALYHQHDHFG